MWHATDKVKYSLTRAYVPPPKLLMTLERFAEDDVFRQASQDIAPPVRVYEGTSFVLDYGMPLEVRDDGCLHVPVQRTSYFPVLLSHPGIHPELHAGLDDYLKALDWDGPSSIEDLRVKTAAFTDSSNPLQRPAPAGVSLVLTASGETDTDPWVLISRRSYAVALNPGVWTTAVDEGVRGIGPGDIRGTVSEGIEDELGIRLLDLGASPQTVGFFLPDSESVDELAERPARSGANEVLRVHLDSKSQLEEIALKVSEVGFECEQLRVLKVSEMKDFFDRSGEAPSEVLAAWYSQADS